MGFARDTDFGIGLAEGTGSPPNWRGGPLYLGRLGIVPNVGLASGSDFGVAGMKIQSVSWGII